MIEMLAASPLARAIGLALVHFLWQGALFGAAAAMLLHLLRHAAPARRYLVGCLALLVMTAAPVLTTVRVIAPPAPATVAPAAAVESIEQRAETAAPVPAPGRSSTPTASAAPGLLARALPFVVLLWSLGVLALTLHLAGIWVSVQRLRRSGAKVGAAWSHRVDVLSRRLEISRPVTLSQSTAVAVPTLVGWIRPVILVPASALTGLTPGQLDAVLTHELAHIRRNDYLVNLLQSAAETLLFYHPAVWWVSNRVRLERELCCDDVVVATCGDRVAYARALTSLEEVRGQAPAFGLAATDGELVIRIRRLLGVPSTDAPRSSAWVVSLVVLAVVPLVVISGAVGAPAPAPARAQADVQLSTAVPQSATSAPGTRIEAETQEAEPPAARPFGMMVSRPGPQIQGPADTNPEREAILRLEEAFRLAKVEADLTALDRLMDVSIVSTNQNGNTRDKAGLMDLWSYFRIQMLTLDSADVRITGDLATVTGRQTELNGTGTDRMLFNRVWRRAGDTWRLVSVTQFRDPNPGGASPVVSVPMARMAYLQYELFKNGTLLGRPTMTVTNEQPAVVAVPDGMTMTVTLVGFEGENAVLTLSARPASRNQGFFAGPRVAINGDERREFSWTFGSDAYLLRVWRHRDSDAAPVVVPQLQ